VATSTVVGGNTTASHVTNDTADNSNDVTTISFQFNALMAQLLRYTVSPRQDPPSTSTHYGTRVQRSRVFDRVHHSSYFMWAATAKYEPAIRPVYPSIFCELHPSSNPTNKNLRELGLEIQTSDHS
jgi:hypothetical protein